MDEHIAERKDNPPTKQSNLEPKHKLINNNDLIIISIDNQGQGRTPCNFHFCNQKPYFGRLII